jgi:hypothetical protein
MKLWSGSLCAHGRCARPRQSSFRSLVIGNALDVRTGGWPGFGALPSTEWTYSVIC